LLNSAKPASKKSTK